ncbi:CD1871A family CXXC motif-containing protein [Desulforamulus ferrireducens]|uniref:Thioredoxin n=1 Tax=Desulforamulus ferrireducens TaxID=1833852 RepID=A0A1S6IV88_9FIRM|nr:CD1871A family CXXC motif-containing protein [Desulforamulus ferrireducens]AQS58684.1 thioredoxin [Desulforamulus ferrireducens]
MKQVNKTKLLFFTGLLFLAVGIWRGEASEVLQKAIQICLECIGIG